MNTDTTTAVAHLYRRAGFGARPGELRTAASRGYRTAVDDVIAGLGGPDTGADAVPTPTLTSYPELRARLRDPSQRQAARQTLAEEYATLAGWWLARMVASTNPLAEKLPFLLHGHFPTAISKVRLPVLMYGQNQVFRSHGPGPFDALTLAVASDPAMLVWLDAASDKASDPNENFARELMERFTMGIGTYSQADVRAGAYCFTGWRVGPQGTFVLNARQHDGTPQSYLGTKGVSTGQQVVQLATHSAASSRFVPAAFWSHLAYPVTTTDPVVRDLSSSFAADRSVTNLLQAIFGHPEFVSETARTGLIKQPTEYVAGTLRALGLTPSEILPGRGLQRVMAGLGQVLFDPPSVGGWPQNQYWLSTASALTRWQFANRAAHVADLSAVTDTPVRSRVDAVAELLSLPTWSKATATALRPAAANPVELVALALTSPDYVRN